MNSVNEEQKEKLLDLKLNGKDAISYAILNGNPDVIAYLSGIKAKIEMKKALKEAAKVTVSAIGGFLDQVSSASNSIVNMFSGKNKSETKKRKADNDIEEKLNNQKRAKKE